MQTLVRQPVLPINGQGAEYCDTENHRMYITLIFRRSHGLAWIYGQYSDGREDHFAKVPEDEVIEHLESELFCWDDYADIPDHVEVTLPRR